MNKVVIEYKNVRKRFDGNKQDAVKNVNLSIEEGTFVTILGTSGSGKTTLLKMTNRIYELTEGEILFYGKDCKEMPVNEYRRQIGYVIQQAGLFPHKTIEENIATVPKLLKWKKDEIKKSVQEMLKMIHLDYDTYAKRYPRQLSGGEQQRVGIARALVASPKIILMDEPFGAIDAITRRSLQDELVRIHKELQNTTLFVTHDIFEAILLGEKIIIMNEGEVQQYDTPYNIMMHPANDFVKKLIFSGDPLEKLKALPVMSGAEVFKGEVEKNIPKISSDKHMNEALLMMLHQEADKIYVTENDTIKGVVKLDVIKSLTT